jgi:hypothetical protein
VPAWRGLKALWRWRWQTRFKMPGGNLRYIAMDEPFSGASVAIEADACHWTPRQTAANALRAIAQVRTVFPDVIVGDIEPVPAAETSTDMLVFSVTI